MDSQAPVSPGPVNLHRIVRWISALLNAQSYGLQPAFGRLVEWIPGTPPTRAMDALAIALDLLPLRFGRWDADDPEAFRFYDPAGDASGLVHTGMPPHLVTLHGLDEVLTLGDVCHLIDRFSREISITVSGPYRHTRDAASTVSRRMVDWLVDLHDGAPTWPAAYRSWAFAVDALFLDAYWRSYRKMHLPYTLEEERAVLATGLTLATGFPKPLAPIGT